MLPDCPLLIRIQVPADARVFFVGDLHGCMPQLAHGLRRVKFAPWRDKLISVGDLTDRGPDSPACLSLIGKPWFHAVRGNHEQMALMAMKGDARARASWELNGGDWFGRLPEETQASVRDLYRDKVAQLPYLMEICFATGQRIAVVHADLPLERLRHWDELVPLLLQDPDLLIHLLWSRERLMHMIKGRERMTRLPGIDALVMGHTPIQKPAVIGSCAYIDTGCYHSGNLTLMEAHTLFSHLPSC